MFFYGIDMTYLILVIPAMLFAVWAQYNVSSVFKRYSEQPSSRGMTGHDSARMILDANGLQDVRIEHISGNMTDHFDPRTKVIRLSDTVYGVKSAAAVGVAAHEAGHAVQYATGYTPMKVRAAIIPVTKIGSGLAMPLFLLGLVFSFPPLAYIGVAFFGFSTLFQLVTLPVEFNASNRALQALSDGAVLDEAGRQATAAVLRAAALTYVAALAVSLMNLLRLLLLAGRSNRRR